MKAALVLLLMLGGCASDAPETPASETDPAITDALNDPIMADPQLSLQQGGASVSVPLGIDGGVHAQTLGQIASARVRERAFVGCNAKIEYAFAWMARLPLDLKMAAGATVTEAAGSDASTCNLRIVRYAIAKPPAQIENYCRKSGYTLSGSNRTLAGVRAKDGAAFWLTITPIPTGSSVDFVTNRGH